MSEKKNLLNELNNDNHIELYNTFNSEKQWGNLENQFSEKNNKDLSYIE